MGFPTPVSTTRLGDNDTNDYARKLSQDWSEMLCRAVRPGNSQNGLTGSVFNELEQKDFPLLGRFEFSRNSKAFCMKAFSKFVWW